MMIALAGCSGGTSAPSRTTAKTETAVPVTVAVVTRTPVPLQITAVGSVQPYLTVSVKAQVGGAVTQVNFRRGQDVRAGEVLFQIDPSTYQAAVQQAQATLEKDIAQQKYDEAQVRRYEPLYRAGIIPKDQLDQYATAAQTQQGVVDADKAAVEAAKLQLSYTTVRAPIDGRTGDVLVDVGNVVTANSTVLVVINQIRPVYVTFSVPAQNLPAIRMHMAHRRLPVEATPAGSASAPVSGILTFVNNTVDISTGTIELMATFANRGEMLWPGEFVNVVLTLAVEPDAIVVPSDAVQVGQQGRYVFVVGPDLKAAVRPVTVARTVGKLSVIAKGLEPGERVVTSGQLRLAPGTTVRIAGTQRF